MSRYEFMVACSALLAELRGLVRPTKTAACPRAGRLDDPEVFARISKGDLDLLPADQNALLRALRPDRFEQLLLPETLCRPGVLLKGITSSYLRRRHGREAIPPFFPAVDTIVASTLGLPLFNEQLMQVMQDVAGFSEAAALIFRKALGKRVPAVMADFKRRFLAGAIERGTSPEDAARVHDFVYEYGCYTFNGEHAAKVAHRIYRSAWEKVYRTPWPTG